MSLKSKIEAIIYASEEPVTLAQLAGVLGDEALAEIEEQRARQSELALDTEDAEAGENAEQSIEPADDEASEEAAIEEAAGAGDQHGSGTHIASASHAAAEPAAHSTAGTSEESGLNAEAPEEPGAGTEVAPQGTEPEAAAEPAESPAEAAPGDPLAETDLEAGEAEPDPEVEKKRQREQERAVREHIRVLVDTLIREYAESDRGIEVREVAGGYRFGTKPEYHDAVRGFVKSLKPALKLSLQALETLAVVAYKQPVTAAEISEIRGVDSAGVLGGLMTRKLIQTAGRKQVVGRPMLYKTTKEFLVRFGLKDVNELPSIEEFEKMAGELNEQEDLPMDEAATRQIIEDANARGDAETIAGELAVEAQPDGDGHSADEVAAESTED